MNIGIEMEDSRPLGPVLRTADRMRLEGCVNALIKEGLNLSLQCPHEALLDHYVRLLLTRLREDRGQHQVEVYFPANTDSLLDRFNSVLADQSVRDATRSPRDLQQVRVWVVHDAQKVPESEMQLLARLIQNFPGARIRALLLFYGADVPTDSLTAFGRKLLRWEIDLPTPEQAQDALETAQAEGRQAQVAQLLRRIGCLPSSDPATPLSLGLEAQQEAQESAQRALSQRHATPLKSKIAILAQDGLHRLQGALAALKKHKVVKPAQPQPTLKWLALGAGVALMLSLVIMLWIQPHSFVKPKSATEPVKAMPDDPARQEPAVDKKGQKAGIIGVLRTGQVQKT